VQLAGVAGAVGWRSGWIVTGTATIGNANADQHDEK
jgi:hypothetical protein